MQLKNTWTEAIKGYRLYLKLEQSLSANTIEAYLRDIKSMAIFCQEEHKCNTPGQVTLDILTLYIIFIQQEGITARSQARFISGIKSFFKYLVYDEQLETSPARLLEAPKIGRHLPTVLSVEEINSLIAVFDVTTFEGQRNRTIIELLYSSGVRVSELTGLKISNINFTMDFLKVEGKGNKERLIPLSAKAKEEIQIYIREFRNYLEIPLPYKDHLFLNRFNESISRISIFNIIKKAALEAGITKNISPHTFRHSFATHLVNGGADLRAVQDMLGHESILTTEIYTHLDDSYLRDTIINHHPYSPACKKE
ncbi:MAG: site-specific tyrosine recombinase/integron integrase [Marinifilaceae bacterium]